MSTHVETTMKLLKALTKHQQDGYGVQAIRFERTDHFIVRIFEGAIKEERETTFTSFRSKYCLDGFAFYRVLNFFAKQVFTHRVEAESFLIFPDMKIRIDVIVGSHRAEDFVEKMFE